MNGGLESMGPLAGPLGACWLVLSLVLLERMLFFASLGRAMTRHLQPLLVAARTGAWGALIERCGARRGLPAAGLRLSLAYRARTPARAEALGRWRDEQRLRLHAHANWLTLLAVATLLLGLLGVALGPLETVQPWAIHAGPGSLAMPVVDLWPPLLVAAMGLTIALTALLAGHGFRVWADAYLTTLELLLNQVRLDGHSTSGSAVIPLPDDET
jgi:biopolymer transport protein ExbB/TolQ